MSCRNTFASSRTTAPCRLAVLFRCTRSAWGLGLQYALHLLIPRLGPARTLVGGLLILVAAYPTICYIWTPTTPTIVLAPVIFLQGFCIGPVILAAGNVVTANVPVARGQ